MNRRRLAALVLALLALGFALGLPALQTKSSRAASGDVPGAAPAAATGAYEYMAELSDEIGPRVAGTPAERRAAERISQWFARLGYDPSVQEFSFKDSGGRPQDHQTAVESGRHAARYLRGALPPARHTRYSCTNPSRSPSSTPWALPTS